MISKERIHRIDIEYGDFRPLRQSFTDVFGNETFVGAFFCCGGIHRSTSLARTCNRCIPNIVLHPLNFDSNGIITGISLIDSLPENVQKTDAAILCFKVNQTYPSSFDVSNYLRIQTGYIFKVFSDWESYMNITRL